MPRILISERQSEVLQLLADHLTIKEIAGRLNVSESAVNQRIKACKERLEASNHRELIHLWRANQLGDELDSACSFSTCNIRQLPEDRLANHQWPEATISPIVTFGDAMTLGGRAPWESTVEPEVVPRVLDGKNADWVRGAAIIATCFGVFATILVGLGAAQGVTAIIADWRLARIETE